MKKQKTKKQKEEEEEALTLKKKICNQLEGKRKFLFTWSEDTQRSAYIEAESEEEAEVKWENGEYDSDIDDCDYAEGSLEIEEVEE